MLGWTVVVYLVFGGLALLLAAIGAWGLLTGYAAANAYFDGQKMTEPATVVSAGVDGDKCVAVLQGETTRRTAALSILSGACDAGTQLRPGAHVRLEIWQGKVTTVYADGPQWATLDNPGQNLALSGAGIFFAVVIAVPLVALLALQLSIGFALRSIRGRRHVRGEQAPPA